MEAPDKIYIHPDMGGREFLRPWLHRPTNNESIEYTRTNAFIEKACVWLSKHFYDDVYEIRDDEGTWIDADLLIEDFEKYMKEE